MSPESAARGAGGGEEGLPSGPANNAGRSGGGEKPPPTPREPLSPRLEALPAASPAVQESGREGESLPWGISDVDLGGGKEDPDAAPPEGMGGFFPSWLSLNQARSLKVQHADSGNTLPFQKACLRWVLCSWGTGLCPAGCHWG